MPRGPAGGGSLLLNRKEKTTFTAVTATTRATADTIITADAVSYDGATLVKVSLYIPLATIQLEAAQTDGLIGFVLYDGSTQLGDFGVIQVSGAVAAETIVQAFYGVVTLTPSAASHTYSGRGWVASTNNDGNSGADCGTGVGEAYPVLLLQESLVS